MDWQTRLFWCRAMLQYCADTVDLRPLQTPRHAIIAQIRSMQMLASLFYELTRPQHLAVPDLKHCCCQNYDCLFKVVCNRTFPVCQARLVKWLPVFSNLLVSYSMEISASLWILRVDQAQLNRGSPWFIRLLGASFRFFVKALLLLTQASSSQGMSNSIPQTGAIFRPIHADSCLTLLGLVYVTLYPFHLSVNTTLWATSFATHPSSTICSL